MNDLSEKSSLALPLRRIVRPTPIARQRKMMIGRIATNSQLMANSFGRSTSIRRSVADDTSVRFPTWLLPALPARADDLDPYRDRDIIALRQSRMKNRIVRQVQPRGLPMAAHAHGRSRSGIQTGPSSIARRLHPIRRQPNRNDAHIGPSSMPLVRVATQPQRPTARPPRTRSTNTPTRNGNRTDRDGPSPRTPASIRIDHTRPDSNDAIFTNSSLSENLSTSARSPKFESAMVARSLLTAPRSSSAVAPTSLSADSLTSTHHFTLPRASDRQSLDRSAIHRRASFTRQPIAMPSTRIPLSMMYESPRRLNPTSFASPAPQVHTTQSRRLSSAPSSSTASVVTRQTKSTSVQSVSPGSPTNRTVSATSNVGPSWISFPTRESSSEQASQRVVSSAPAVTVPSAMTASTTTSPSTQPLPKPQSLTAPNSLQISATAAPRTAIDSTTPTSSSMRIENQNDSRSANSATVRRRVGAIHIPRAAGWRQVLGMSHQSEQPIAPQTASHHQDSLFRRVAALANPTNAPLGSPGDIARRSPVSGSLISIASSMRSALLNHGESTLPTRSLPIGRLQVSRKTSRRPVSASRSQPSSNTISDDIRPAAPSARSERALTLSELIRRDSQRKVTSPSSVNTHNSSASSRTKISRQSSRNQKPSTSSTSQDQKPSFVDMWSSVNQSAARQSHLIARRSLRLPQVRVHSIGSKPGTVARQQFGLNARSTEAFDQSPNSTVLELRRRKSQRASHALRSASQGNPSSARVLSIARESRSHMSSVTPGASSGTQFAGSLARAISRRQTQRDTARYQAITTPRESLGAARQSTTAAIQRSAAPNGSTSSSVMPSDAVSLTGAGSHVAQNFLNRLGKKTGEDFAPVINTNKDLSVSPATNSDVIARSVTPLSRAVSNREYSLPFSDQSNDSPGAEQQEDQPHWAFMRTPVTTDDLGEGGLISIPPSAAESSDRAAQAMGDAASVTNGSIMRSGATNPVTARSNNQLEQRAPTTRGVQRSISKSPKSQSSSSQSLITASRSRERNMGAKQSRQAIIERGGSIASRGALHRSVSRSVPTQRLSSPLNDLPVSPNVTPGMRIPSEAMSALPALPNAARVASTPPRSTSATLSTPSADNSRSASNHRVVSRSASSPSTNNVRRDIHRSVSIRRQANGVQFGPSEDGTISADALARMIETGQSIPNQVVHRQVSGTTSSGIMRRPSSSDQVSRSVSSTTVRRSSSTVEKAAPGPVSILSQVLAPADGSDSDTNQITTSQLLDLMDWINRIVDDRLRQELERRGVAGGRW